MKNSSIVSAVLGGAFFAVPYLALSAGILPSLAIGACAFGAGELLFYSKEKKTLKDTNRPLYEVLEDAKNKNAEIKKMISEVKDEELQRNIKEITDSVSKIINTVTKKPAKYKNMNNFFDYYLPVTLNIIKKYDEIENQNLVTDEGKKFMKQAENMLAKINVAFKNQLSNLYQSEMVDTDAEMKVFDAMLKTDGYDTTSDFNTNKKIKEDK